ARYEQARDDLAADATSRLSISRHLGLLSPLQIAPRAPRAARVRQLAWRDFFAQLPAANPHSSHADLHPRRREWNDDADGLAAWKDGQTRYAVAAGGTRQPSAAGFMQHVRA